MSFSKIHILIIDLFFVIIFTSCPDCDEASKVSVPEHDETPPEVIWEAEITTNTPSGDSTYIFRLSTTYYVPPIIKATDKLKIKYEATDNESGIQKAVLSGTYTYQCTSLGSKKVEGKLPTITKVFDLNETCVSKTWEQKYMDIEIEYDCGTVLKPKANGEIKPKVKLTNYKGVEKESYFRILVRGDEA